MAQPVTLPIGNLPNVGTLSYGDVRFEELFKSKVIGRAEWDRARRAVKYIKYTLEVDGYVLATDSRPNDPTWARMRYTLQRPGLALAYSDRGFARFNINTERDGLVDVCNGPHPEVLEFTPMGARLAAHVVWRCEICLPEITAVNNPRTPDEIQAAQNRGFQTPFSKGILAFNWTTELRFQTDGYADYTVEGELEIARVNGRADNLESYRAWTEPQIPTGFKPIQRTFKADDAKRQIKFVYSFTELPVMGIPVRCTAANGSYRVSCTTGPAMVNWTANLQASYTVVPTGPRREAYMRFIGLLLDRMRQGRDFHVPTNDNDGIAFPAIQNRNDTGVGDPVPTLSGPSLRTFRRPRDRVDPPRRADGHPIVRTFAINEGLYEDGKTTSFECSWTFITTFESLFRASGVWRRMGDCAGQLGPNNRDVWVSDMASVVGYTSWYNYGFRPDAEIVITPDGNSRDPVNRADKTALTGNTLNDNIRVTRGAGLIREGVDPDSGESPEADIRLPGLPSPEASWLNYQLEFITELDPGIALHKALPQHNDKVDTLGSVDMFSPNFGSDTKHSVNTVSLSTGEDILQRMATSTYRVCLRGYGVRVGYKVPVPSLIQFGGATVSPAKQRVTGPQVAANYSGIPVYVTAWILWYDVPLPPRRQQVAPPNMAQHIGDVASPPISIAVPVTIPENKAIDKASLLPGRLPR